MIEVSPKDLNSVVAFFAHESMSVPPPNFANDGHSMHRIVSQRDAWIAPLLIRFDLHLVFHVHCQHRACRFVSNITLVICGIMTTLKHQNSQYRKRYIETKLFRLSDAFSRDFFKCSL
jgi:hypothetical protein